LRQSLGYLIDGLGQLLWPGVCINCGQSIYETDGRLCGRCWQQLQACVGGDYCRRCGRDAGGYAMNGQNCPDCQGSEFYFDRIARGGVYGEALRDMTVAFKNGRTELDSVLAVLINAALAGSGFAEKIDYFVPVPLHWRRRLIRGYNQSLVLAKRLNHSRAKVNTDLVRIRHTKAQPMMTSPAQRRANVAGAFAVRRGHKFAGRVVCLVDDVKTTGATLNECAKTLKEASASMVFALVAAVAGQNTG